MLRQAALESKKSSKRSSPGNRTGPPSKKSYAAAAGSACSEAPSKGEKSKGEKSKGDSTSQAPSEAASAANLATRQMRPATSAPPPAPPAATAATKVAGKATPAAPPTASYAAAAGGDTARELVAAADARCGVGGASANGGGGALIVVDRRAPPPPPMTLDLLIDMAIRRFRDEIEQGVENRLQESQSNLLSTVRGLLSEALTNIQAEVAQMPIPMSEQRLVSLLASHLDVGDRRQDALLSGMHRERLLTYLMGMLNLILVLFR